MALVFGENVQAQTDSTTSEPRERSGRVRISIDEKGISVEGDVHSDKKAWVHVSDDRDFRELGQDIVRFGESVFVKRDEVVSGDLVIFGADAVVEGRVTGDVVVIGGAVRLRPTAEVRGNVVVIGGEVDADDAAVIYGEVTMLDDILPARRIREYLSFRHIGLWALVFVITLFIKLVLVALVVLFMRDRVERASAHMSASFLKSFGVGILATIGAFIGTCIVSVLLAITLFGAPLVLMLLVSFFGVAVIGWTAFAHALGSTLAARSGGEGRGPLASVLVGALFLAVPDVVALLLGMLHVSPLFWAFVAFSWLVRGFAYTSGFGAIVLSRFGSRRAGDDPPATSTIAPPPAAAI